MRWLDCALMITGAAGILEFTFLPGDFEYRSAVSASTIVSVLACGS